MNTITCGATVKLTEAMSASVGYAYGFHNSMSGGFNQFPNTNVTIETGSHSLLFNMQVKFGGGCN